MSLFDEDCDLSFDDMGWNVDSVLDGESAPDPDFDLSKETQDFLDGGIVLQDSPEMGPPSTFIEQIHNDHISPRGIADNVEQHNSCNRAESTLTGAKQALAITPATVEQHDEENRHQNSPAHELDIGLDAKESSDADKQRSPERLLKETSLQQNGLVSVEPAESPIHEHEQPDLHKRSNSQERSDFPEEQVPRIGDDLDGALRSETPLTVNEDASEFPRTRYEVSNVTKDPIESLMQLPDHIRLSGDLDSIFPFPSIGTAAEADSPPQDFMQLPTQIPNQESMITPTQATHQLDLSSNDVISNHEPTSIYRAQSHDEQGPNGVPSFSDSPTALQVYTGTPAQNNIPSSPGMHLDAQTIQQVVQAYHSNVHPHLQSPLSADCGPLGHALGTSGANIHVSLPMQSSLPQRYPTSTGPSQGLSLRPTEGIMKRRGRKKSVRDPTKPPLTPRRRKTYTLQEKNAEQPVALPPGVTTSGMFHRSYVDLTGPQSSMAPFASDPVMQFKARLPGRPASFVRSGVTPSALVEIQPVSSGVNQKQETPNTAKAPGGVDSGHISKKPGRKGGRINPETAHLSVEERRSLRAKRNRESAEKSRVRRKVQTAELEMSVAQLRNENKSLKSEVLQFQAQLSRMSIDITQGAESPVEREQILREQTPTLFQALMALQRVINECPRTFRPPPHSEIQLKINR